MYRTSAHTALAATGVGMTLLLAGCGSGGSGSAAGSPPASQASSTTTTTSVSSAPRTSATLTPSTSSRSATSTGHPASSTSTRKTGNPGDAPVPRCTVDQLHLSLGDGNADMQGTHWALRFTNISGTVCKLIGAPGVSYVAGSNGHQVGMPATRIVGHQPVVLIPNATASAGLFTSSAPEKSACQQVNVRGLRIYPPDSYQAAYLPHPAIACAGAKSGPFLRVGPILPGPNNADV